MPYNAGSIESVSMLKANGTDRIRFTFGCNVKVNLTISQEDSFSVLSLDQTEILTDDKSKMAYSAG